MAPLLSGQDSHYRILQPRSTHFVAATCEEVGCENYAFGWTTKIDESTALGQRQADYIRNRSGRHFVEQREGALTLFLFSAEQSCFTGHERNLIREPLFLNNRYQHRNADDWVDDFANNQDRLARIVERG